MLILLRFNNYIKFFIHSVVLCQTVSKHEVIYAKSLGHLWKIQLLTQQIGTLNSLLKITSLTRTTGVGPCRFSVILL